MKRSTIRRTERAVHDTAVRDAILDEAPFCHVGFVVDGHPVVIPTIHARIGDNLYLHGSGASSLLGRTRKGTDVSVCVTILDGLVMAKSVFHHSMNYRSVVVFGRAERVTDPDEKLAALEAVTNHVQAGRWDEARQPTRDELTQTVVVRVPLDETSTKMRTGPPVDDEADLELDVSSGVVPVRLVRGDLGPA
jgi:nitroimidazol reductase NimA-like FMN-containing flavoprotein (pyridoxamine 5'-phosphate oxidase superfamily)